MNRQIACAIVVAELLAGSLALAQAPAPAAKLPEEGQRLKSAYQKAADRAVQPLRERYLADLKRLLEEYTRAGKLDQALAIRNELAAVSAGATAATDSIPEFEHRLHGTVWLWSNSSKFTFEPDGTTPGRGFKWQAVKPYTLEYQYPSGHHGTIVFDPAMSRATINETDPSGQQKKLGMTRVRE